MHVCLLGPLVVRDDADDVAVVGARQRAVLAYLALRAGEVVARERMVVDLWGEDAPARSANTLQQTVHRLRQLLPPDVIVTEPAGYVVRLDPAELDTSDFTARVARGRALLESGRARDAVAELDGALGLWRGEALADFRYEPFAQAEIARLEELRLACLEERAEALLAAGASPSGLVADLRPLVAAHPGRERLCGLLMRACYQAGRQTHALDAFRRLQRHLDDELGLEPSPALVELQRRILVHDPRLAPDRGLTTSGGLGLPSAGRFARASRRLVTVLCVQGLPPAQDAGPPLDLEAWDALVSRAVADVERAVLRHGGVVRGVLGAQVVAVFGVESVHEDDAVRAVAAAVELAGATRGAPEVQCGVASGEALVGGADAASVTGDVMPRAVELARSAGPGGIVVDRHTCDLAGAALEVDRTDGALRVVRVHPGARPVEMLMATPFVGREADLGTLADAFADVVRGGRARTVVVTGEAGIGKTRLLRELAGVLQGATVLRGRCPPPYGGASTFTAIREIVSAALPGGLSADALTGVLGRDPQAGRVTDVLVEVLRTEGDRRTDPALLAWAVRRFVEVLAARRPVALVLDDLHWAPDALLDLAEQVVAGLARGSAPVLSVASGRPEFLERRDSWRRLLRPGSHVELGTLAPQAVSQLLHVLSEGRGLGGTSREHLLEAAGGNPLFLEQLVAWNAERPDRRDVQAVPPSLTALLSARLQRLGPAEQEVLDVAAVVGRDVDAAAVVALLPESVRPGAVRHLAAIAARGLLVLHEQAASATGVGADTATYAFRHALIHEVAYRAVPRLTRARLHERVAQWLDAAGHDGAALDASHDVIGFHLERSVQYRRELGADVEGLEELAGHAAGHLEKAAARASDVGDASRAEVLYRKASEVFTTDDIRRGRPLVGLGAALTELGRFTDAAAVLAAARDLAGHSDPHLAAHARVQELRLALRVDMRTALNLIRTEAPALRATFGRHGDDLGTVRTWELTADMHWSLGRAEQAEAAWEKAARLARAAKARSDVARVLGWLASAAAWGPRPVPDGIARCENWLEDLADFPVDEAVVRMHLVALYAMAGDFERAARQEHVALTIYSELGDTVSTVVREPAACAAMLRGDLEAAEVHLRHQDDFFAAAGETGFRAGVTAQLAMVVAAQDHRLDEASALLRIAEDIADPLDLATVVILGVARSTIALARGDASVAVAEARAASAAGEFTDLTSTIADCLVTEADALMACGLHDEAAVVLERAIEAHRRKGNVVGERQARRRRTAIPIT